MKVTAAPPYDDPYLVKMRVKYIKEYAVALQEESEGKAVIVYMDETYLNVGYQLSHSWFSISSDKHAKELRSAKGSGRLIILHAVTKDGLLCKEKVEVRFDFFLLVYSLSPCSL
jgi:hypothetical protein